MFTTLSTGQPGIRSSLSIEIHAPAISRENSDSASGHIGDSLEFVASDESLDRYHEVISASGWRLDSYRRNPVFQNAHQYGDVLFTIGKALVTDVRAVGGRQALCQRIQFATDVNPMARIAYGLYRGKFLNAVSVGFIPLRWQDGNTPDSFRRKYLEQELLEVSAVGIPANPNALVLGLKCGAVEKSDLHETLELLRNICGIHSAAPRPDSSGRLVHLLLLARELRRILRRA